MTSISSSPIRRCQACPARNSRKRFAAIGRTYRLSLQPVTRNCRRALLGQFRGLQSPFSSGILQKPSHRSMSSQTSRFSRRSPDALNGLDAFKKLKHRVALWTWRTARLRRPGLLGSDGPRHGVRLGNAVSSPVLGRVKRLVGGTHDLGQVDFTARYGKADADRHARGDILI